MTDQPNKPGAEDKDGTPKPAAEQPAVENQGSVTPEDYPDQDRGKLDEADRGAD